MQATKLARAMVTRYGMSEALGKVAINYEDNGRSLSSETRNLVETEASFSGTCRVCVNIRRWHTLLILVPSPPPRGMGNLSSSLIYLCISPSSCEFLNALTVISH